MFSDSCTEHAKKEEKTTNIKVKFKQIAARRDFISRLSRVLDFSCLDNGHNDCSGGDFKQILAVIDFPPTTGQILRTWLRRTITIDVCAMTSYTSSSE